MKAMLWAVLLQVEEDLISDGGRRNDTSVVFVPRVKRGREVLSNSFNRG